MFSHSTKVRLLGPATIGFIHAFSGQLPIGLEEALRRMEHGELSLVTVPRDYLFCPAVLLAATPASAATHASELLAKLPSGEYDVELELELLSIADAAPPVSALNGDEQVVASKQLREHGNAFFGKQQMLHAKHCYLRVCCRRSFMNVLHLRRPCCFRRRTP